MKNVVDPKSADSVTLSDDNSVVNEAQDASNNDDIYLTVTLTNRNNPVDQVDMSELRNYTRSIKNERILYIKKMLDDYDSAVSNTVAIFIAETPGRDKNLIDLIVENGQHLKPKTAELKAAALLFEDSGSISNKDGLLQIEKIWAIGKQIDSSSYDNIFEVTCSDQSLLIAGSINGVKDCTIFALGGSEEVA